MILDKLDNLGRYEGLNPFFTKAFQYIAETDFNSLKPGKYAIDDENIFALVMEYETKAPEDCMLEAHLTYTDIQYLLNGEERVGIASLRDQAVLKPYRAENDIAFYDGEYATIKLDTGNFVIFFPDDLHMPCLQVGTIGHIRKVVVKVRNPA